MSQFDKGYSHGLTEVINLLEDWIDISNNPEYIEILTLFHYTIASKLANTQPAETTNESSPQLLLELQG